MTDIDPEMLAKARAKIAEARKRGFSDHDIDAYLQSEIGVGLSDVVKSNARDFWRTLASGVTLGHGDELAGAATKLIGGDYRHARDAAREEQAGFSAVHPRLNFATEAVAGGLPALLANAIPGLGPNAEAGWLMKAGKAAGLSGAVGTVAGEGHSEGTTAADIAKDAATSLAISATLGGLLSTGASGVSAAGRKVMDTVHPEHAIVRESATQLPANAAETLARQEALAPGTAVNADLSGEMQAMTRGVGADAKAGVAARLGAESRLKGIQTAMEGLSAKYESLNRPLPIDQKLKDILQVAGRKQVLPKDATDVDFITIQRLRTALKAEAKATRNSAVRHDKNGYAAKLTDWLEGHVPELKQVDSDWSFLTKRIDAARETLKEVTNSSKNYAASRAYGADEGSVGGSLALSSRGSVTGRLFERIFSPDRAGRARAANDLLLTPGDATSAALDKITAARSAMGAPASPVSRAARAGLLADLIPQLSIHVPGLLTR